MTAFYKTLGVSQNASAADIKRAYRRKAAELHPDREGGDDEAMSQVNQAYECLSDPERRKHYDETGADRSPNSREHEIEQLHMQAFSSALKRGATDIVSAAEAYLQEQRQAVGMNLENARQALKGIERDRKKVRRKRENALAFERVLGQAEANVRKDIAKMEAAHELVGAAIKTLRERYESVHEDPFMTALADGYAALNARTFNWGRG